MLDTTLFGMNTCASTGGIVSAVFASHMNLSLKVENAQMLDCAYCLDAPQHIPAGSTGRDSFLNR